MTEKEIINKSFEYATGKEKWTIFYWSIFKTNRFREFSKCIDMGMHIWAAMDKARLK